MMKQKQFSQDFTENVLREQEILPEKHPGFGAKTGEELAKALLEQDISNGELESVLVKMKHLLLDTFAISYKQQREWMLKNLSVLALGNAASAQSFHKTANRYLEKALENMPSDDKSPSNVYKKAKLLNNLGCSFGALYNYEKAGLLREEASVLADSIGARDLHWKLYHNMAGVLENNKQYELAQEHYTTIINTIDSHEYSAMIEKAYFNYTFLLEGRMVDVKKEKNRAVRSEDNQAAAAARDKEKELGKLSDLVRDEYYEYLMKHSDNPEVQELYPNLGH